MEHGRQLGRRQPFGPGEEAAGEHLEGQVPRRDREVDVGQERAGVGVVEQVVDLGHGHRGQRCRGSGVEPHQVPESESGTAQREHQRVPRRSLGQTAEGVLATLTVDQRVVLDGAQPVEARIAAPQQCAQVVVLPEERVEAAVVGHLGSVGQLLGPAADATAQIVLPFQHLDGYAAFGQSRRGCEPGDTAADDHNVRGVG